MTTLLRNLRTEQPLTNDQLFRVAPSAFATQAYHQMSDKYAFIPTIAVVERMRAEGFVPVQAAQSRTATDEKRGFAKHMIRFRDARNGLAPMTRQLGEVYPELVLTNSHDGASAYRLDAGLYRLVCTNGMTVADSVVPGISVRHTGNADGVINASYEVIDQTPKLIDAVESWQRLRLEAPAARAFATAALQLRYDDPAAAPITPEQVLQPRRREDVEPTLWNVFNRTQEALVSGGVRGRNAETGRRLRTRPVEGISENNRLNKALWTLGEEMAKLLA